MTALGSSMARFSPSATARADYETAQRDLGATRTQAAVLTAHAMALRLTVVLVPVTAVGSSVALLLADLRLQSGLGAVLLALILPWGITFLLTFPLLQWASLQTFWRGSRDERLRFGVTDTVYLYYGWRYAFRGRRRGWGALSVEEKRVQNPKRAARYWPEDTDNRRR